MKNKLSVLLLIMTIFAIDSAAAQQLESAGQSLGMKETPQTLYRSFRTARPRPAETELPSKVDLSSMFPVPGNQGEIGSCTAWATAYAAKSFQENLERGWGLSSEDHIFSPSFIYNQIHEGWDSGAYLEDAVAVVQNIGAATLATMPYTEDITKQPSRQATLEAGRYKAKSFSRVDSTNINAVKSLLANRNPVLIGMTLQENFEYYSGGVYRNPEGDEIGGHAMCVVGYDDDKKAFKVMNSWGTEWGDKGFLWVDYEVFAQTVVSCIVMYDIVETTPSEAGIPINLAASKGAYEDKIKVSWTEVKNAKSYIVYRADKPSGDYKEISRTQGTVFLDQTDLTPGKIYYYSVKSVAENKISDFSDISEGYTIKEDQKPGIPQNIYAYFRGDEVALSWDEISGAEGYYIYKWSESQQQYSRIGRTGDTQYKDSGNFNNGDIHWYFITAFKGTEESQASEAVYVEIYKDTDDYSRLIPPPEAVTASEGSFDNSILINWDAVAGSKSYNVYKWDPFFEDWLLIGGTKELYYKDTKIINDEEYYCVTALDSTTESELSSYAVGWLSDSEYVDEYSDYDWDDSEYYEDYNDDFWNGEADTSGDFNSNFNDDFYYSEEEYYYDDEYYDDEYFDDYYYDEEYYYYDKDYHYEDINDFFYEEPVERSSDTRRNNTRVNNRSSDDFNDDFNSDF